MEEKKKKLRTDKKRSIAKVAKTVLFKPLLTDREIAEKTWLWKSTVNRARKDLGQAGTKDDRIVWLIDTDFAIVLLAQQNIMNKLQDPEEMKKTKIGELSTVARDSAWRYTIFGGNITDDKWKMNAPLTDKQIEAIQVLKDFL
jgi:beta-xylosidase